MSNFSPEPPFLQCLAQSPQDGAASAQMARAGKVGVQVPLATRAMLQKLADERLAVLARTIEHDIIPRLLLSHARPVLARHALASDDLPTGAEASKELTEIVLAGDPHLACAFVADLRQRGVPLEGLFLDLLGPTARRLGELWESDQCTFTDVTIGLSCLQQVLREFSPAFEQEQDIEASGRRILLVPTATERHTFGLFMVEEFFRRAGWDVWGGTTLDTGAQVKLVRCETIDVVGFSISSEKCLGQLVVDIGNVRKASRNKDVCIMIGGSLINMRPELVGVVGADATASDGRDAVVQANGLVDRLAARTGAGRKRR